jgi:TPR repeat protein
LHSKGLGVKQDFKEAFKYYKLAADQGYALGQTKVDYCYYIR